MGDTVTVRVSARRNSVGGGTGAQTDVFVEPGQLLMIHVDPADTWSAGTGNRTSNANGLGNPLGGNFGVYSLGDFEFLYGSLVGSLDGGQTFFGVGTYLAMTALQPGELSLYYWDSNREDNSGEVTAYVRVYDPLQL